MKVPTVRIPDFTKKKPRGEKIAVLTAYDAPTARVLDQSGLDVLLVGDSLGMVALGHDTTLRLHDHVPSFVKQYACIGDAIRTAATVYVDDVRTGAFPPASEPLAKTGA